MSPCTRNCWIFAALLGLVVWGFSMAGDLGVLAGLFLGFITAWLLVGLMVLLFCEGEGGGVSVPATADRADADAVPGVAGRIPQPRPDAPPIAGAVRPAGMTGAPAGAGPAARAMTFKAEGPAPAVRYGTATASRGAAQPLGFAAPAETVTMAVADMAAETPIEDSRATLDEPSDSIDHEAPGEVVPGNGMAGKPGKPRKSKDEKKDRKARDKSAEKAGKDKKKDKAAKRAADAGFIPHMAADPDTDAPLPAMTLTAPAGVSAAGRTTADTDDLGRIDGIGPKLTGWLHENGITRFAQIAEWTPEDAASWAARLGRWGGRIESDDWIGQARILAAGGETAHSRRVDRGDST